MAFVATALMLAAAAPAAAASAMPAGDSLCRRAQFRVVLDVGHTSEVPGALSARGVPEYEFNLSLARRVELALIAAGFEQTERLITEGPARAGLYRRVSRANGLPADLLVSIHHDSVPEKFLQGWEYAGNQLRFSDRFKGHSIFVSNANRHQADSLLFARLLGLQLKARGLHYTPHYTEAEMGRRRRKLVDAEAGVYRFDRLMVLRATTMPAVLLEAGSIINRDEELLVGSAERQALISAAVTSAVARFCAVQAARTGGAQAARTGGARKRPQALHTGRPQARGSKPAPAATDIGRAGGYDSANDSANDGANDSANDGANDGANDSGPADRVE